MKDSITIALSKGRNLSPAIALLEKAGFSIAGLREDSRKLIHHDPKSSIRFIVLRASDVPTYVEHGAADMGIAGKDVIMEQDKDVYEPLDLKFGPCRMVVAEPQEAHLKRDPFLWTHVRVATKFPHITAGHFSRKGVQVEIIKLYGAIELAPLVGLAELIVDLVSTGQTLKENGLMEVEEILQASARLIVNRASHKTRYCQIEKIIRALQAHI